MGADHGRVFSDIDDALFDTTRIPTSTRDARTVGELLFDVDHMARQLLMEVTDVDAGRLLRGWPAVVAAATDLWSSLPAQGIGAGALDDRTRDRNRPISQVVSVADAIGTSLGSCRWPPPSRPDHRMTQMAQTLSQAGALVRRYGTEIPIERTEAHRDLEATRARIMHALYVTAHAVGVSLHQHGRTRFHEARNSDRPLELSRTHSPYAVPPTIGWIRRIAVSERAAGRYLSGRFTQALAGEASRPVEDDTRISRALAGWDIQAHRTLASEHWPVSMLLITRTPGLIAGAAMVLVDAAQLAGELDPSDRLTPAIAEAGRAWSNLASRWGDLTPPDARLDPDLMHAAAEVRAAYRELTHNATTMASLDTIATRPGLPRTVRDTLHALESGSEIAYVVTEKAHTPGLSGPARALSIRAHNDIEAGLAAPHPDGDVVWVSPADIVAQRTVPLPAPVRELLRTASAATASAASTAADTATLTHANCKGATLASPPRKLAPDSLRSSRGTSLGPPPRSRAPREPAPR